MLCRIEWDFGDDTIPVIFPPFPGQSEFCFPFFFFFHSPAINLFVIHVILKICGTICHIR